MSRGLEIAALAALLVAGLTVALRDPEQPFALASVVVALGVLSAAVSARLLLARVGRGRGAAARAARAGALRRGAAIGLAVGVLLGLRAIDGLTVITGGMVLLAFGLAEVALTARRPAVR